MDLTGWRLRDASGSTWAFSGTAAAGVEVEVRRNGMAMSMGNGGDTIELVAPDGTVADPISYGPVGQDEVVLHP